MCDSGLFIMLAVSVLQIQGWLHIVLISLFKCCCCLWPKQQCDMTVLFVVMVVFIMPAVCVL